MQQCCKHLFCSNYKKFIHLKSKTNYMKNFEDQKAALIVIMVIGYAILIATSI